MKKYLTVILIVVSLLCFCGCKNNDDVLSDFTSFSSKTDNISSGIIDSSDAEPTTAESEDTTESQNIPSNNKAGSDTKSPSQTPSNSPSSQNNTSDTPSENSTDLTENQPSIPTLTARQKMTGEWRFILPENKHTADVYAFVGHRLVYDITISDDNNISLLEKHYKRSDFDTIGAIEYFEGKRYTLVYTSQDVISGSFSGDISISPENENTAILNLSGYEIATGQQFIKEKHYLTLTDDSHLSWTKAELLSEGFNKKYFPWDNETVFLKK